MQDQQTYQYSMDHPTPPPQGHPTPQNGQKNRSGFWKYFLTALVTALFTFVLTASAGLILYFGLSGSGSLLPVTSTQLPLQDADNTETREALEKLSRIYTTISGNYYRELSDAEMIEAMANGLAGGLDSPYTMYFTAEQNQMLEESYSGEYSGIGAIVAMNPEGLIEIIELVEDGPAIEAGLQIGDVFVSVNEEDVTALPDVSTLAAMVRGPENTSVDLEMYRPISDERILVSPLRRKLESVSVRYHMLDDQIGYISISEFSKGVADHFIEAVDALQEQGATSLVFDLRNNSGGLADEVTDMLDYLLPEATIASFEGRMNGSPFRQTWESDSAMGVPADMKFVVLINPFSASASELFAGCLSDYDRAYLIGQQTFGKGSGTITFALPDGSAVNVTNFLYYLPNGESIEGTGLTPDLEVILPEEARIRSIMQLTLEEDTQLAAAVDWLNTAGNR